MRLARGALLVVTIHIMVHAAALHAAQLVNVEPDDYGRGAVISHAVPGVTLSVEGRSAANSDVKTVQPGLGRTSTGELIFGYDYVDGSNGFTWRDDSVTQAFFVASFDAPTAFVAIDIVRAGGPGDTADPATLVAFDIDGNHLATVQTLGGSSDFETALISRAVADISTVRVTGTQNPIILDNLRFEIDGDLPPPSCEERLQSCETELVWAYGELEENCDFVFRDTDGDGEHDSTDRCSGTPFGESVDDAGCSIAQFCSAHASGGRFSCYLSDWRNDEPRGFPRDCRSVRTRERAFVCVPR